LSEGSIRAGYASGTALALAVYACLCRVP
jgi:hypothetical protein